MTRPAAGDYPEHYQRYLDLIPEGNIYSILAQQLEQTVMLLNSIGQDKATERVEEGSWTINEIIGHVIDTERVFAYRGLVFSRHDETELPGFDQNDYVRYGHFNDRSLQSLTEEIRYLRRSNIILFQNLSDEALDLKSHASGYSFSVRAIPYLLAGHERHHINKIRTLLHTKTLETN